MLPITKPGAVAVRVSFSANRLFSASMMPLLVIVEPVMMSMPFSPATNGPFLPMNWPSHASSAHLSPIVAVWLDTSTVRVAMVPSSFRVTFTVTSPPMLPITKPGADAVRVPAGTGSAEVSTEGSSTSSSPPPRLKGTASGLTGAAQASFTASTTAVEVTVAPASASMPAPRVKGALLPINCSAKLASVVARVPKPMVSPMELMFRPVMTFASSIVSWTSTSD